MIPRCHTSILILRPITLLNDVASMTAGWLCKHSVLWSLLSNSSPFFSAAGADVKIHRLAQARPLYYHWIAAREHHRVATMPRNDSAEAEAQHLAHQHSPDYDVCLGTFGCA